MKHYSVCFLILLLMLWCASRDKKQGNFPPEILSAKIAPEKLSAGKRAGVSINAVDKDKDDITFKVEWFANDKKVFEGREFYPENLRKGDRIYAVITPYDGKEYGKSYKTPPAHLQNLPPEIVEANFLPDTILTTTEKIEVKGKANDPDGDEITLLCEWYINGKKIEQDEPVFKPRGLKENDLVEAIVYAFDGQERSRNFIRISTIALNSPPVINIKKGEIKLSSYPEFTYKINAYDPDEDSLKFSILSSSISEIEIIPDGTIKGKAPENVKKINITLKVEDIKGNSRTINLNFSL